MELSEHDSERVGGDEICDGTILEFRPGTDTEYFLTILIWKLTLTKSTLMHLIVTIAGSNTYLCEFGMCTHNKD